MEAWSDKAGRPLEGINERKRQSGVREAGCVGTTRSSGLGAGARGDSQKRKVEPPEAKEKTTGDNRLVKEEQKQSE